MALRSNLTLTTNVILNQQQRNHPRQSFVTVASKMIFFVLAEMDTGELKKGRVELQMRCIENI